MNFNLYDALYYFPLECGIVLVVGIVIGAILVSFKRR